MSCSNTLKSKGFRITRTRKAILEFIHDHCELITAEDIISHVQKKLPDTNKSTIYRTLRLLEDNQCIFSTESKTQKVYYHIEEGHHHHCHLVCNTCGSTAGFEERILLSFKKSLGSQYGFIPDLSHIVVSGICQKCQDKSK